MSEQVLNPVDLLLDLFTDRIRQVVHEELKAAGLLNGNGNGHAGKEWLKACELADRLFQ